MKRGLLCTTAMVMPTKQLNYFLRKKENRTNGRRRRSGRNRPLQIACRRLTLPHPPTQDKTGLTSLTSTDLKTFLEDNRETERHHDFKEAGDGVSITAPMERKMRAPVVSVDPTDVLKVDAGDEEEDEEVEEEKEDLEEAEVEEVTTATVVVWRPCHTSTRGQMRQPRMARTTQQLAHGVIQRRRNGRLMNGLGRWRRVWC